MKNKLILVFSLIVILSLTCVSASRLPSVGSDNSTWGDVLNDYLSRLAGANATELNLTMVNGTNIYFSSINTTHIIDKTITGNDLADNSVNSSAIDLTEVTLSTFTNDANYLDKDEGGTIDGSLIINGNFTLIGDYLNATVTNQYLNGSFLPEITNIFNLGSSVLQWANIYVTNLHASKIYSDDWTNVTIQESQINDLQSYLTSESDPLYSAWNKDYGDLINTPTIPTIWDATFNTTGDNRWGGADTQKSADGNYLYNDTTIIYFNETKLNGTIDNKISGIAGDNSSWNESYADTKYLGIQDQRYNETTLILSVNTTSNIMSLGFYNETEVDNLVGSAGNSSFNQTLTDTLYYSINNPMNFLNQTQTDLFYAPVNYGDGWNKTYADTLYADISVTGDNSSWNQSHADTLYMDINQDDWIDDGEESDLNVNSSYYWGNLGTINETQMESNGGTLNILVSWLTSLFYTESEIDSALAGQDECSEITGCIENAITTANADIAFVNATGDTMTGNLNVTGNITTTDTFCFNADCSAKMYHNGSGIIISS